MNNTVNLDGLERKASDLKGTACLIKKTRLYSRRARMRWSERCGGATAR